MIDENDILSDPDKYREIAEDPYSDPEVLGVLFFAWPSLVQKNPGWILSKQSHSLERGLNFAIKHRNEYLFNSGFDRLRETGLYLEGLSQVPDYIVNSKECRDLISQKLSDSTLDVIFILRNMRQWDVSSSVKKLLESFQSVGK